MKTSELKINGMSCGHCVMAVKKALSKLPVNTKEVKVGSAEIEFDESQITLHQIEKAIEDAGYKVV
ncbi:MAG: heavy-metal-associated domain-containing protein [Bacillota bacterium]